MEISNCNTQVVKIRKVVGVSICVWIFLILFGYEDAK